MRGILPFHTPVYLQSWASAVGKEEHKGPLGGLFDFHDPTDLFGEDTWEKAEGGLCRTVLNLLFTKAALTPDRVDALFGGDLQNQCVATATGVLPFAIPFLGLYGACSTCTEGILTAALTLHSIPSLSRTASVTTSHNCAAERQFRQPIEYGGQRPPTAQWTATAGGAFLLGREGNVRIEGGMIGRPIDGGINDAGNMGAAMAPAAADTVLRWFSDVPHENYDAVITGDLGAEGQKMLRLLLTERGLDLGEKLGDCGVMLYDLQGQDAHAGASGCGCSASVLAAYFLPKLAKGALRRVLFLSTGALMSPTSIQQGENILGIAHAISLTYENQSREA